MLKLNVNWDSVNEIHNNVELTRLITFDKMRKVIENGIDTTVKKRAKVITDRNGNELVFYYDADCLVRRVSTNCDICNTTCVATGIPVEIETQDNVCFVYDTLKYGSFCSVQCAEQKLKQLTVPETLRFDMLGAISTLILAEENAQPLNPVDDILIGKNLFFMSDDIIFIRLPCTMPYLKGAFSQQSDLGIYVKSPKAYEILERLKCNWQ